ncbi:hypothetical protein COO92_01565 [Thalassospira lohafexi]|uniref:Uncharacterized protein n=1 Tax=Thalassospira lohafexi TaxID=744227 RepID=A0A2N3LBH9_9PROT|nr:hypothetical protein COO92_01565 [Thalassospira lohafexi]
MARVILRVIGGGSSFGAKDQRSVTRQPDRYVSGFWAVGEDGLTAQMMPYGHASAAAILRKVTQYRSEI